jgi:hypothetical protein
MVWGLEFGVWSLGFGVCGLLFAVCRLPFVVGGRFMRRECFSGVLLTYQFPLEGNENRKLRWIVDRCSYVIVVRLRSTPKPGIICQSIYEIKKLFHG